MVVKKNRYAELYENVPGKRGKKRFVRYLGILGRIDWKATFGDTDNGVDWIAIEQAELARINSQEAAEEARAQGQRSAFKEATGLDLPVNSAINPVPIEKAPSQIDYASVNEEPAQEEGPADAAGPESHADRLD